MKHTPFLLSKTSLLNTRTTAFFLLHTLSFALLLLLVSCSSQPDDGLPSADSDNGGLILPDGFEAFVVVDSIGPARHIAVNDNGDIYVKLRRSDENGSLVALRDTTGDGRADIIQPFGFFENEGNFENDVQIRDGYLYFSTNLEVLRQKLTPGQLIPEGPIDTLVYDDHEHGVHQHQTKPFSFDDQGNIYVPYGSPTDTCQDPPRTPGLMALDPCPIVEDHGGVWRYDANGRNQTQADGELVAEGFRSVVAMDWNPADGELYLLSHGRDFLFRQWPELYSRWDSAMLPAEEFARVTEGFHLGWPYCYYDQMQEKKVLNPEYGGDGEIVGRCSDYDDPLIGFPGHFAPNGLMFYQDEQFPDHYKDGAFMAFHGSTIRNPYPQAGYFVAFVPFENGEPQEWEVFANGFAGVDPIVNTSDASHRPMGLATGPDGSLYITDTVVGKVWRVIYRGDREEFGEEQLARMREEKETASNIRTPREPEDNLELDMELEGGRVYSIYCSACHQGDGQGAPPRFPGIAESSWITGDKQLAITVILNGLDTDRFDGVMPSHDFLRDDEVAEIATYVRQQFAGIEGSVTEEDVREVRQRLGK